ncbi:hypothetical protein P154DRAFT_487873 [Amniculicola lignicola CBS 123094]|uniref:Myosin class II heavy chain n=1 Tax=Amniculicola lignicola CBS 123094 TaxID=1392246 RepID=A0A6A5WQ53_9PLEO|nr:hypothetical protein P154DRAFT_487873 [Amniculicola lignicola CBS 123094]
MQARRSSSVSLPPPSSPPSVLQFGSEVNSPSEARGVPSPAQSLWTAPSPTQTLGHSSPELPPLPAYSAFGSVPRTPSTINRHDDNTSYYTASWGSPYRHPPPVFNHPVRNLSAQLGSDDLEDSSNLQFGLEHLLPSRLEESSSNIEFGLEHLLPPRLAEDQSPNQFNLEHLIPSRLPRTLAETPTKGGKVASEITPRSIGFASVESSSVDSTNPPDEWVRQFLEQRWNPEANNWKSDESTDSDAGTKARTNRDLSVKKPVKPYGHRARADNKTLVQQDFWSHFSQGQKEELSKMMASRYADPEAHSRQPSAGSMKGTLGRSVYAEKPASPIEKSPALPSPKPVEETASKPVSPIERVLTPRPRKKVMVKGKGCVISMNRDIPRGMPGYPPKPMSAAAVEAKLQQYEQAGYDVRGFGYWGGEDAGPGLGLSQHRGIWPSESALQEWRATRPHVRVPRKADWDAYVDYLLEQKLAALGVSQSGEEEDASMSMSRQTSTSQHPGLPFSPPLPTLSAGSHRTRHGSIVSGGSFPLGPSPGHMSRQSMASPMGFGNTRPSMHMHRHSTFSPASFIQQTQSPTGAWSPGNYFSAQGPRGGSPALSLSRPDLASIVSPSSPFAMTPNQQFPLTPVQKDDLLAHMQHQQQALQAQLLHQQQQQQQQLLHVRPSSTLAEVPEDEAEEDELPPMKHVSKSGPEIAVPTPRGHRHNISANLEREARDAESYHLEEAIGKQFDEGGDFSTEPEIAPGQLKPSDPITDSAWEGSRPVLHQPQPHNRAHSLAKPQKSSPFGFASQPENPRGDVSDGARTNISDATNPSLENEQVRDNANSSAHSKTASQVSNPWKDSKFAFSKSGSAMHSKHTSRSSISKLNVEAKEFKFNPAASFSPGSFSSSGFSFSPAIKSPGQDVIPRSTKTSIDGLASLNVAAPVFKPDAPVFKPDVPAFKPAVEAPVFKPAAPIFKPTIANGSAMPTSGFDFFSKAPSFKPDAPAFNPGGAAPLSSKPVPTAPVFTSRIFGNVNMSAIDIVKPAKRSKAIPIIRPDATRQQTPEQEEPEHQEDESGRIMQADGREKRARRGRDDGGEVPKFALQPFIPSQPLAESKQPQTAKQDPQLEREVVPEDKENLSPNLERAQSKSKSPEPLSLTREAPVVEPSLPTPQTEASTESRTPIDDLSAQESDAVTPTAEKEPETFTRKHTHKSSLSAAAKPFEFRPQFDSTGFDLGIHVTRPSIARSEDFDNTHISPPRQASRSPATTFRPSDDGSWKTALEGRRRLPYPESESMDFDQFGSFNEIDAVMKHMNEEGSDFGVERDEPSWGQTSPRRSLRDFERSDLQPHTNQRSDAPSPSPRRLFAPRNLNASSTSNLHDPFDDERAGIAYESPVHRLNNASEVPMSDWDEGISSANEEKVQSRSRFFDHHVDDLIGRVLQSRLGPLESNLQAIQDSIALMSHSTGRGRRSMSTNDRLDSDADDEDDELGTDSHYRARSPRKDRKLEKIRSIVKEALESHQPLVSALPVPVPEPILPERIREIVIDALAAHQPSAATVAEPLQPDSIRSIVEAAIISTKAEPSAPITQAINPDEMRSIVKEALASHTPKAMEATIPAVQPDDIRTIVMEAFATHAPQPVQEPTVHPDVIRSIVTEALASHQPTALEPALEPVQPDMIRSIVAEALASHKPAPTLQPALDIPQPQLDMSELYQVIGSLKASIAQAVGGNLQTEDVRVAVGDVLKQQNLETANREESQALVERDARIAELEASFQDLSMAMGAEVETRKALERREADTAHLLKITEEELTLLREAASDDESKIRALKSEVEDNRRNIDNFRSNDNELQDRILALQNENEELKLRAIAFESSEEDIKKKLDVVSAENEALTSTLEEHRISSNKWRGDIQQATEENERMRKAIESSRMQAEEAARVRENMRSKFEQIKQEMVIAAGQAAAERAQWQKSDEEHMKKYEILSARIEAEGRTRERLELELDRLETQEREGMRLRVNLEQSEKYNTKLEETIEQLKQQNAEHQNTAERYERQFREAREAGHVEIRRTRMLMEADIEAANNQVNIVRADLEAEVARVRQELDNVRMEADTTKAKHELDLEAAADVKKNAVVEIMEAKRLALLEQRQGFDRHLEQLSKEHSRALDIAREDKDRAEVFSIDRQLLADSKVDLLKEKVSLLEEKLAVAKEAANAAAAAAQSVKSPGLASNASSAYASGMHDRISSQALRESIAVLQEQLQEREFRIESLEHQLSESDTEAPAKLKERDTEIGWLRELLGVRIDDLNDLINALAQPTFDRETVRDAAIRIRTNLQMEQSEKERLMTGGQNFPTLATLSNFASPKAVQLAAAFGNWRKGRENASSALAGNRSSNNTSRNQTPSRPSPNSAQSFLSGLMTPPTSNLRRTPNLPSSGSRPHALMRSGSTSSRASTSTAGFPSALGKGRSEVPSTPPLMRKASYDQDAEDGGFSESGFYDDESLLDGETTPIGMFGSELRR